MASRAGYRHQGVCSCQTKRAASSSFIFTVAAPRSLCYVNWPTNLVSNGSVKFCGGVSLDRVADVIANADLGVVPKRADSFGNEAYSTKIMEFMSQGVPVVVSRTKIDTFYFEDKVVRFFASGDSEAMADAMLSVIEDGALRKSLVTAGYEYVNRHSWEHEKSNYFELVDTLSTERF